MKSKRNNVGTDIKISGSQINQQGGSFLSALIPMAAKLGSMAIPYITKMATPLATGALSGLSNVAINKLFKGKGLFNVPQDKVDKLIKYKPYLTQTQKTQIVNALQNGSGVQMKLTKKKQGNGFFLSALASLAIPAIIKAISGKGLQVDPRSTSSTTNVFVPPKGKGYIDKRILKPPPFYGQ